MMEMNPIEVLEDFISKHLMFPQKVWTMMMRTLTPFGCPTEGPRASMDYRFLVGTQKTQKTFLLILVSIPQVISLMPFFYSVILFQIMIRMFILLLSNRVELIRWNTSMS